MKKISTLVKKRKEKMKNESKRYLILISEKKKTKKPWTKGLNKTLNKE